MVCKLQYSEDDWLNLCLIRNHISVCTRSKYTQKVAGTVEQIKFRKQICKHIKHQMWCAVKKIYITRTTARHHVTQDYIWFQQFYVYLHVGLQFRMFRWPTGTSAAFQTRRWLGPSIFALEITSNCTYFQLNDVCLLFGRQLSTINITSSQLRKSWKVTAGSLF